MKLWARPILFGVLGWFIPFLVSFTLLPIKKANTPLFTTLMYLIVLITAGVLLIVYFHRRQVVLREAVMVGSLWLIISLVLDFPMFAFGPMKMTRIAYYSEIGLVYTIFPIFAFLSVRLIKH